MHENYIKQTEILLKTFHSDFTELRMLTDQVLNIVQNADHRLGSMETRTSAIEDWLEAKAKELDLKREE